MAATQDDIRGWLMKGKRIGATHAIIVCDTFDWTDFPNYVRPGEDVSARIAELQSKPMLKVMEVYNLAHPFGPQLDEERAWNL